MCEFLVRYGRTSGCICLRNRRGNVPMGNDEAKRGPEKRIRGENLLLRLKHHSLSESVAVLHVSVHLECRL